MKRSFFIFVIISLCLGIYATIDIDKSTSTVEIPSKMETEMLSRLNELNESVEQLQQRLSENKPQSAANDNEDNGIITMLLGVCCLLGISNLVLLIFLLRKTSTSVQSNPENVSGKIAAKDTVGKADSILNAVQGVSLALTRVENRLSQFSTQKESPQQTYQQQSYQPIKENKIEQPQPRKEEVVKQDVRKTLYVQPDMDGGTIKLIDGGEDYKEMMPFLIQANGGEGIVRFNNANLNSALENLETTIMPYSICSIGTPGMARHIETVKDGHAQLRGNQWVLTEKPTLNVL